MKQVLSKFAIDLTEATKDLHSAIEYVNQTEKSAQQPDTAQASEYPQERFDKNYPEWESRVESGRNKATAIITQLSNSYKLTEQQLDKLMQLKNKEPLEGDYTTGENNA